MYSYKSLFSPEACELSFFNDSKYSGDIGGFALMYHTLSSQVSLIEPLSIKERWMYTNSVQKWHYRWRKAARSGCNPIGTKGDAHWRLKWNMVVIDGPCGCEWSHNRFRTSWRECMSSLWENGARRRRIVCIRLHCRWCRFPWSKLVIRYANSWRCSVARSEHDCFFATIGRLGLWTAKVVG